MTLESYPCPRCKGSGNEPDSEWLQCTECYGNRMLYRDVIPLHQMPEIPDEPPGKDLEERDVK